MAIQKGSGGRCCAQYSWIAVSISGIGSLQNAFNCLGVYGPFFCFGYQSALSIIGETVNPPHFAAGCFDPFSSNKLSGFQLMQGRIDSPFLPLENAVG